MASCSAPKKSKTPAFFSDLSKRYPELFPYANFSDYQFVREVFTEYDSLKMRLYDRTNSGDRVVVFINKAGKSYAFPMPENRDGIYWKFYGEAKSHVSGDKNFESEMQKAFETLSLDRGWIADAILHEFAVSLLQTRIVFSGDGSRVSLEKTKKMNYDTMGQKKLKEMYDNAMIVIGLSANTFYDYNHGRYYQFESNMPCGKKGFTIKVYREPGWVEPMYL